MDKCFLAEYSKKKSIEREKEILAAIEFMKNSNEKISFYSVSKKTGASKSYLYNNPVLFETIDNCRKNDKNIKNRSEQYENKKLKSRIVELEKYKEKCKLLERENKALKEQLLFAYKYNKQEE